MDRVRVMVKVRVKVRSKVQKYLGFDPLRQSEPFIWETLFLIGIQHLSKLNEIFQISST